ncbi:MAG: hypothetical protein A2289_13435 [Deltaproteobacteria bacterium RIFOXYA12_FULL_58_15]|nr:MAG: hypothetical protein A2289_13435 [Deltaproteobacteria bacterium RIFOXYA12_FULL_58_15]OGR13796.1 MAG: hypothetical protein A2341_27490 [Deltaproteobacteria bacterium RIFOXYB12_FULL_58_9]
MRESLDLFGFFTLGLLGGFGHCVGMCGPFVLYVSRRFGPLGSGRSNLFLHQGLYGAGRVITYTGLGAVVGALGGAVDLAADMLGIQRVAAALAGGLLIVYALASLLQLVPRLAVGGGPLFARVAGVIRKRAPGNALLTGILLGFLPCGLLYVAVIAAAARGGAVAGGLALLVFGVGTMPAMLTLSVVDELLARHRAMINRLSMVFILIMGVWFLWQGVGGT